MSDHQNAGAKVNVENAGDMLVPRIDLAREAPFMLGGICVEPSLRRLSKDGEERLVEPKLMQVLVALVRAEGRILSRDDLIDCCWDGRVVGDASVNRVLSLLRTALRDLGGDAVTIETVPRVGYRVLVAPGAVEEPQADEGAAAPAASRRRPLVLAAICLAVLAAAFAWWWSGRTNTRPLAIVMLPLEASEGVDPLYANGMQAEIRSQLGQGVNLEVTAGDSARQLAEQGQTPEQIGRALGADLVWQGELSNSAENVTLDARLIEVESGDVAWSNQLQAAPNDAEFLPLRAVREVLEALGRPLNSGVADLSVSSGDYALYLTAMGLVRGRGYEQREAALEILEQVNARNPRFADGLAGLAKANFLYPTADRAELQAQRALALEQAEAALQLDPRSVDALKVSAMLREDDMELRLERLSLATEIDPGDAEAWFWLGIVQREAQPDGGDMLATVEHLVSVDPLWPASWRGSDAAVEFGDFALARELEQRIIAAAANDAQREQARARLARIDGDLSEFMRLVNESSARLTEAERRRGAYAQLRYTRMLLGLDPVDFYIGQATGPRDRLLEQLRRHSLPPREDFVAAGVAGARFWDDDSIVSEAMPMLLRDGRTAEFLAYYDAKFASPQDYVAWAHEIDRAAQVLPYVSPYVVLAMRRVGRLEEARQHVAIAREWTDRWRNTQHVSVMAILYQLQLAAIEGDSQSAGDLVRRLPDYGWPLQLSHFGNQNLGLLLDDPLYDEIRDLPEVRAVLGPIRAHIARERQEVLELGLD